MVEGRGDKSDSRAAKGDPRPRNQCPRLSQKHVFVKHMFVPPRLKTTSQDRPKNVPDPSKRPQQHPEEPPELPRATQDTFRSPLERSKSPRSDRRAAKTGPRPAQDYSKRTTPGSLRQHQSDPRPPREPQRSLQEAPRAAKRPPKTNPRTSKSNTIYTISGT